MLVIFGWNSEISVQLRQLLDSDYEHEVVRATFYDYPIEDKRAYPLSTERYFFASGYLAGKSLVDMTPREIEETVNVNFKNVVQACDAILAVNEQARICVIGSESGFSGSYDDLYAMSKSCLHDYICNKRLKPEQQLVGIAPGIISDAGMTLRRTDLDRLHEREHMHPKKRFLRSVEVARLARFLLYEDEGYISNTVIRMNGGEHVR